MTLQYAGVQRHEAINVAWRISTREVATRCSQQRCRSIAGSATVTVTCLATPATKHRAWPVARVDRLCQHRALLGAILVLLFDLLPSLAVAQYCAYVTSPGGVFVIDTANQAVSAEIPLSEAPTGIAATPDSRSVFTAAGPDVLKIDTATNVVVRSIPFDRAGGSGIAVAPNGRFAYVTDAARGVAVINTTTNAVVTTISVVSRPDVIFIDNIGVTPDGQRLYVTNGNSPFDVFVMDTGTNTVVGPPIQIGSFGTNVAITPDGAKAYVGVAVINTATNTVSAHIVLGGDQFPSGQLSPTAVALSPEGRRAYIGTTILNPNGPPFGGAVWAVDTSTNEVVGDPILLDQGVGDVAVTPDGHFLYATAGSVYAIDTTGSTRRGTIPSPFEGQAANQIAIISCQRTNGQSCLVDGQCSSAFCVDHICCDRACNGANEFCKLPSLEGTCVTAALPSGHACATSDQCSSTFCVDSICCDRACDKTNEFCTLRGLEGTCVAVSVPTATLLPTTIEVPSPTSTASPPHACAGDCNRDGSVTVDELLVMVSIALGNVDASACTRGDLNHDGQIAITEILTAVNAVLNGCP
jgi:YVTN family beta-propeller protein